MSNKSDADYVPEPDLRAPQPVDEGEQTALAREHALLLIYDAITTELTEDNIITGRVRNLAQAAAMLHTAK